MTATSEEPATGGGWAGDPADDPVASVYAQEAEVAHRSRRSIFMVSLEHHDRVSTASVIDVVSEQGWTLTHMSAVSGVDAGSDTLHLVFVAVCGERGWRT
jgi:hypothetical protein